MTAIWIVVGLLVWAALAVALGLLIGRTVRLRDQQPTSMDEYLSGSETYVPESRQSLDAALQAWQSADESRPENVIEEPPWTTSERSPE